MAPVLEEINWPCDGKLTTLGHFYPERASDSCRSSASISVQGIVEYLSCWLGTLRKIMSDQVTHITWSAEMGSCPSVPLVISHSEPPKSCSKEKCLLKAQLKCQLEGDILWVWWTILQDTEYTLNQTLHSAASPIGRQHGSRYEGVEAGVTTLTLTPPTMIRWEICASCLQSSHLYRIWSPVVQCKTTSTKRYRYQQARRRVTILVEAIDPKHKEEAGL